MCVVFREVNNLLLCYKMGRVIVETNSSASHTNKYVPYCCSRLLIVAIAWAVCLKSAWITVKELMYSCCHLSHTYVSKCTWAIHYCMLAERAFRSVAATPLRSAPAPPTTTAHNTNAHTHNNYTRSESFQSANGECSYMSRTEILSALFLVHISSAWFGFCWNLKCIN